MKQVILFVDDDRRRAGIYVEMLRCEGYDVAFVSNIKDADNYFEETFGEIDLVVLDIIMPGSNFLEEKRLESRKGGIEFLRKIRLTKTKQQLPVVVLSIAFDAQTKTQAFRAGCNVYLEKPCLPSVLLENIEENLQITA